MKLTQSDGENLLRRYEYDDRWVIAADVDVADDRIDVDTVGDTAIVVIDQGDQVSEAEIDLPGTDANVDVNNGVLTIEVTK